MISYMISRLPEPDLHAAGLGQFLVEGEGLERAGDRHRNDGYLRLEGHAGDTCLASVQAPIRGPRAFREDADQVAFPESLDAGLKGGLGRRPALTPDRDDVRALEEPTEIPLVEVVRFRQEDDLSTGDEQGQQEVIEE
jgi:hypothetical protein